MELEIIAWKESRHRRNIKILVYASSLSKSVVNYLMWFDFSPRWKKVCTFWPPMIDMREHQPPIASSHVMKEIPISAGEMKRSRPIIFSCSDSWNMLKEYRPLLPSRICMYGHLFPLFRKSFSLLKSMLVYD